MSLRSVRDSLRSRWWGRALLALLALLYGSGVRVRNALYTLRLLPVRRLSARTVCIGNISTGGTGKTTAVLLAAQTLHKRQVKAAILSRGYGRKRKTRRVQVLLNTQSVPWEETGDEPWMMHHAMKGLSIPILISPDRFQAGRTALTYYNPEVLILDDGFQHRKLGRDADIVLLNSQDPFGGGRLLPAGDLREPASALRRAKLVLLTHTDQVAPGRIEEIRRSVQAIQPHLPVLESVHRPDFLFDLKRDHRRRLNHLKNKPVACFSALGDPRPFEAHLRSIGARLVQTWRFPDHHPYTEAELRSIENVRQGIPVVTTMKDFPRLPPGWRDLLSGEVLALAIRMSITKGKLLWESTVCGPALAKEAGGE